MAWAPGQSGNPGGRPKLIGDVQAAARKHTADSIAVLAEIAMSPKAPPAARVTAATALLDRAWGKPAQAVTGADGGAIQVEHGLSDAARAIVDELTKGLKGEA